jgi:hypothetical protein
VAPSATFNQAVSASSITFTLFDTRKNPDNDTTIEHTSTLTATFTPAAALA